MWKKIEICIIEKALLPYLFPQIFAVEEARMITVVEGKES